MKKLFLAAVIAIVLYQVWGTYSRAPKAVALPAGTTVVLYATDWCGYCAKTRKFLAERGIAYTEFDIE